MKRGWNNSLKKVELVMTVVEVRRLVDSRAEVQFGRPSYPEFLKMMKAVSARNLFERTVVSYHRPWKGIMTGK